MKFNIIFKDIVCSREMVKNKEKDKMNMIDLTIATNCIRVMKENGTYRGQRIGRLVKDVYGEISRISGFPEHSEGRIVLFREQLTPSDSELCMGEYMGREQKPTGFVTIEVPLSQEEIEKQRARGSRLITMCTMVGVPVRYVEEIRI